MRNQTQVLRLVPPTRTTFIFRKLRVEWMLWLCRFISLTANDQNFASWEYKNQH